MTSLRQRVRTSSKEEEKEKNKMLKNADGHSGHIHVVRLSAVGWVVIGIVIGILVGGPWVEDILDYLRDYRWDYRNRCIQETPEPDGYGVDFCRVPVNCDNCRDVTKIDEINVNDLSIEMFEERYAYTNRPLVVRNASLGWRAMTDLRYSWLKEEYLRDPEILQISGDDCWFNRYQTTDFRNLASLFRIPEARVKMRPGTKGWYLGWAVCQAPVAEKLHELYERPAFISPDSTPPKRPWIFIGTPGPGAHFHIDNVELNSWQAQITGRKKWMVKPPPECRWTCGNQVMESILYPGDIIVVNTNIWFHSTEILKGDLSLVITNEYD